RAHPMGQVALEWTKDDGSEFGPADVKELTQTLDLWRGTITSVYTLGGVPVKVITACDSKTDTIAVTIESSLVSEGKLRARLAFMRGHDPKVKNTPAFDWSEPASHRSTLMDARTIERSVSGTNYFVATSGRVRVAKTETPHE